MSSIHVNRVACGIHVVVHGNLNVSKILDDYNDVIAYSSNLSLLEKGTIFIYLKSTYEETVSDQEEYMHSEDITRILPILSDREQKAINELNILCYCNPKRLMWVKYSDIM